MIVILMSGDAKDLSFDAQALATVAELGITSLALLRDDDTLALSRTAGPSMQPSHNK